MSAQISFLAGDITIQNLSGSGLGFYGQAGFGASVPVGSWQSNTYITSADGSQLGPEAWNVQYLNNGSGIVGGATSGIPLTSIPNYQATNIRFTFDTPVQVQQAQLYIYDRVSINNPASGVMTATAQIIHPNNTQNNIGSGDTTWNFPGGTGVIQNLANSPGTSGLYAGNGAASTRPDTQHDWYVVMSASPNSIGSKTQFGAWVQLEYF